MTFATDLQRIAASNGDRLENWAREVKIELFSSVVELTRVDTGRLRGNWQIQENTPARGTLNRLDPTGIKVKAEIINGSTPVGLTYFANNLPYAMTWEKHDAMVGRSVARVRRKVRDIARALNK